MSEKLCFNLIGGVVRKRKENVVLGGEMSPCLDLPLSLAQSLVVPESIEELFRGEILEEQVCLCVLSSFADSAATMPPQ